MPVVLLLHLQPAQEKGLPPPASGDDVNYYQLAIQHSEGLSKDAVFSSMREMLIRLGEAAQAGKDLRLDLGAGHLCVAEREVSFEFGGGLGAAKGDGGGERTSHLDPMTGKQANKKGGGGGVSLFIGVSAIEQPTGGGGVAVASPAAAGRRAPTDSHRRAGEGARAGARHRARLPRSIGRARFARGPARKASQCRD